MTVPPPIGRPPDESLQARVRGPSLTHSSAPSDYRTGRDVSAGESPSRHTRCQWAALSLCRGVDEVGIDYGRRGHMDDGGYVSRTGIVAGALWLAVLALILGAWGVVLFAGEHYGVAGMLAASGCALSALAATLHIKTYACRVSQVVRASAASRGTGAGVRPLN